MRKPENDDGSKAWKITELAGLRFPTFLDSVVHCWRLNPPSTMCTFIGVFEFASKVLTTVTSKPSKYARFEARTTSM